MFAFVPAVAFGNKSFNGTSPVSSKSTVLDTTTTMTLAKEDASPSLPFMPKPKNLDESMAGYTGFDPMGLASTIYGPNWMVESEIKHGRIAMLGVVGMLVQEFIHLPGGPAFSEPLATSAITTAPVEGILQIVLFCGFCEWLLHKGKITPSDMHADGAKPGHLGFNPLNLAITPVNRTQEVKNGRLAMIASGGFIHQMLLTKQPIIEQLTHFQPLNVGM